MSLLHLYLHLVQTAGMPILTVTCGLDGENATITLLTCWTTALDLVISAGVATIMNDVTDGLVRVNVKQILTGCTFIVESLAESVMIQTLHPSQLMDQHLIQQLNHPLDLHRTLHLSQHQAQ